MTLVGRIIRDERFGLASLFIGISIFNWGIIFQLISYELSIYEGVSGSYVALLLFILVGALNYIRKDSGHLTTRLSILLVWLCVMSIVILPFLKGYFFIGEYDALTHLGYVRDIFRGDIEPFQIPYPFIHVFAVMVHIVGALTTRRSLLFVTFVFPFLYMVFTPLAVRRIDRNSIVFLFATFSGILLLPIYHISSHMHTHPSSQALLLIPLLIFLLVPALEHSAKRYTFLFTIGFISLVLLHPQQGANLVMILFGASIFQLVSRYSGWTDSKTLSSWILTYLFIAGIIFWLRVQNLSIFAIIFRSFTTSLFEPLSTSKAVERSATLSKLGGSTSLLFLKLFFVRLIYCIGAAVGMVAVTFQLVEIENLDLRQYIPAEDSKRAYLFHLTGGYLMVFLLFMGFLVSNISDIYHRYLAFMFVIMTIMAAIPMGRGIEQIGESLPRIKPRTLLVIFTLVIITVTLPIVHSSPYIYKTSQHVSESQYSGFKTTFRYADDDVRFNNIGSPVSRYGHATVGTVKDRDDYYPRGMDSPGGLPPHVANRSLSTNMTAPMYLTSTTAGRKRHIQLYDGFFHNRSDFKYLETESSLHKISTNGGFTLYYYDE